MGRDAAAIRGSVIRLGIALGLALAAGAGLLLARGFPEEFSAWFLPWSQAVCGLFASATGWIPVSLAEVLVFLLPLAALATLAASAVRAILWGGAGRRLLRWGAHWLLAVAALAFVFVWSWGISYEAPSLIQRLGYRQPDRSTQSLYEVCLALEQELNTLADQVPRDGTGGASFGSFSHQAQAVSRAAERFFSAYPAFQGSSVPVKPVASSEFLSRCGITGIYICLTGESNVNTHCPDSILPFTMAHEMAHRAAIAPEEEANFTAFLLCLESEDAFVRYSGVYQTFIYCYNALSRVSPELQRELYDGLDPRILQDFSVQSQWVHQYDGPQKEQAQQVNDTYLKTMNQSAGIESYGQVVDLVLAWYQSK